MRNKILVILAVIINVLLLSGCGKTATYTYNVKDIKHYDSLYITKTTYYNDRVEIKFKGTDSLDGYTFYTGDDPYSEKETKYNTLVIYSDNPSKINSVQAHGSWTEIYFRYLDSDEYATIWHYWADDLGWTDEQGDKEKYYTLEEQRNQAITAYQISERIKLAEQVSNEIFEIIKGKWVSEDGSYFDITEGDWGRCVLYYEAARDGFTECSGVNLSWISEEENTINILESPYESWGAYYSFDIELSEDGKSFEYESQTFYLADEETWGNVDIEYVYPVKILFDNADKWKVVEAQDETNTDEINETDETVVDETEEEKPESVYKYALTDLNMNGLPEVILSGRDADGICFLETYEVTEDGGIEKKKINSELSQPALYDIEELLCNYTPNRYQDVYKYLVEGRTDYDDESYFIQNYLMSVQINSLVLEKFTSQKLIDDGNDRTVTYYNENDEEISSVQYREYMMGIRDEFNKTVNLSWFDEITIENMAKSLGVFLESMNYEEE
ncbi:MAG: hypothetical protein IKS56_10660 [Lachnospiraceae bacterium]|nr:hypothetical protein [Lachnospiraceae bacterium]